MGILKKSASAYTIIVQIALAIVVLIAVLPEGKKLIAALSGFSGIEGVSEQSLKIMLKAFGLLSVGSLTADICRDNGENALASVVEIGVKILAVSCALPVFQAVITMATSFFNR